MERDRFNSLQQLLARWAREQTTDRLEGLRSFIVARQAADGGFTGRAGDGDIYYTAFALRCLAILEPVPPQVTERAAAFLDARLPATVVEALQWLHARRALAGRPGGPTPSLEPDLAGLLRSHRSADGGWAKRPGGEGSTYWTFLALLCLGELGLEPTDRGLLQGFLTSRHRPDGGFAETGAGPRGSTNATAAGTGALLLLGGGSPEVLAGARRFLLAMAAGDGGFRAGARAPVADLLSTFTASLTLVDTGGPAGPDPAPFLRACRSPAGGFRAGPWDGEGDLEYTFYGMSLEALLAAGPGEDHG